jgi:hypothetical protein
MITSTARYAAASDIARSINRDLDNDPNFTLSGSQLDARIDHYCDDPATDDADRLWIRITLLNDPCIPIR